VTFSDQANVSKYLESDVKFRKEFDITKMTKQAFWNTENAKKKAKQTGENVDEAVAKALKQADEQKPVKYEDGRVLTLSNITDASMRREDFKQYIIENGGAVDYISFETGKTEAKILLNLQHGKKATEIMDGDEKEINIKGCTVLFKNGDEKVFEEAQKEYFQFKKEMTLRQNNRRGKNKRNDRSNRGSRNDRNREEKKPNKRQTFDSDGEEPVAKVTKTEQNGDVKTEVEKKEQTNGHAEEPKVNGDQKEVTVLTKTKLVDKL